MTTASATPTPVPTSLPSPILTPLPTPSPTATPAPVAHLVETGDTLSGLALQHGVSIVAIQLHTGWASPPLSTVRQTLIIPSPAG